MNIVVAMKIVMLTFYVDLTGIYGIMNDNIFSLDARSGAILLFGSLSIVASLCGYHLLADDVSALRSGEGNFSAFFTSLLLMVGIPLGAVGTFAVYPVLIWVTLHHATYMLTIKDNVLDEATLEQIVAVLGLLYMFLRWFDYYDESGVVAS